LKDARPLARDSLPPPRPRTKSVTVRCDEATLQRVQAVAARRHPGYQTLIKQLVVGSLGEYERRDRTVG
jgi:hypothetical protein